MKFEFYRLLLTSSSEFLKSELLIVSKVRLVVGGLVI